MAKALEQAPSWSVKSVALSYSVNGAQRGRRDERRLTLSLAKWRRAGSQLGIFTAAKPQTLRRLAKYFAWAMAAKLQYGANAI